MSSPTRRRFLQDLASLTTLPAVLCAARGIAQNDSTLDSTLIIDTHQHLWDLSRFKLPWLDHAAPVFRKSYREEEYLAATQGLNLKAVYMEVDVSPDQREAEAEYVIALCRDKKMPTIAAVIGARPADPGFKEYITRFQAAGAIRGVRQVLQSDLTPRGTCLKDEFISGMKTLANRQLSFDLCMRPAELRDGLKLSELCPDTRLILDHCGNADVAWFSKAAVSDRTVARFADQWKRDIKALGKRPNVICKISGIVASAPEHWSSDDLAPIVNHCLDAFGSEKVIFGGDWPICLKRAPLIDWIRALRQIISSRPNVDQLKLWSQNAIRLYGLKI